MLTVSQLSKTFAGRALFDDVTLQVNRGDRISSPAGTAFQVRETLSVFVGGNDEPVSIVAMHSKSPSILSNSRLDGVLHDG